MSISTSICFYFELQESAKRTQMETKYSCSNENCEDHNSFKQFKSSDFCPKCGNQITEKQIESEPDYPSVYEFSSEYLANPDMIYSLSGIYEDEIECSHYWGYNLSIPEINALGLNEIEYGGIFDLSKFNPGELLEKFKKKTDVIQFLQVFKSIYGEDSIEVKIGIHSYYD